MDFRDIKEFFRDACVYIVIIAVVLLVNIYIVSFEQVVGPSMQNTLENGNVMVLNKILYKISSVIRCDVISFEYKSNNLIKRVIGLPGEHIEYKDNYLYINGVKYEEPYITNKETKTNDFKLEDLIGNYSVIPDNMYLVLGDNRENSMDSREIGLISKSTIRGKISIRIWPISGIKLVK